MAKKAPSPKKKAAAKTVALRLPDEPTLRKLLKSGWKVRQRVQKDLRAVRSISESDLRLLLQ
jgi:hypothetical protein